MSFYKIFSYIYSRLASKQNKAITYYPLFIFYQNNYNFFYLQVIISKLLFG